MRATALGGHGRTVAFAVPLVLLTAIAHAAVGGALPSLLGLAVLITMAVALSLPAARAKLSVFRVLALYLGGQFLLHVVMTFLGGHSRAADAEHGWLPSTPMSAAHIAAAIAMTGVVTYFDRALNSLHRMARTLLGAWSVTVPSPSVPCSTTIRDAAVAIAAHLSVDAHRWRGPPIAAH
jgi:hypothetical protein